MAEHPNYQAVQTFLDQLPATSARIVGTEKIDGTAVSNGYTASWSIDNCQRGFTVISYGDGKFLSLFENVAPNGKVETTNFGSVNADAESAGRSVAAMV